MKKIGIASWLRKENDTMKNLVALAEKSHELEALQHHPWLLAFRHVFHAELQDFLTTQKRLEAKGEGVLGSHPSKEKPFAFRLYRPRAGCDPRKLFRYSPDD